MPRKKLLKVDSTRHLKLSDLMKQFVFVKKAQGMSERTIKDYQRTFDSFQSIMDDDRVDINEIKEKLLAFFADRSGKAPATYNVPYANLTAFFTWAVSEQVLEANPIKLLGLKKKRDEGRARHVEEETVMKLLNIIDITTYAGLRDYAIILLTMDTGIRPKEAFSLRNGDVELDHHQLTVRREIAKTRRTRTLPLSPQTVTVLKRIQLIKPTDWDDFLFTTVEGYQMTVDRWQKRLQEFGRRIGVNVSPYDLRHSFAIMFLRNGGNVFALQHEMGHADLSMTKRYVNLVQNDLKEQHCIASPVSRFVKRTTRVQKLFKG